MSNTEKTNVMPSNQQTHTQTNNNSRVFTPEELNAELFSITKMRVKDGRKIAYLLHDKTPAYCETPWLRAPFGVSGFTPKGEAETKKEWSVNLSAGVNDADEAETELVSKWFEQWLAADDLMLDYGFDNAEAIFGKKKSREVLQELNTRVVKGTDEESRAKGYPLRLQPKIPKERQRDPQDPKKSIVLDTVPSISIYMDGSIEPVDVTSFDELEKLVPANSFVKAIIQPKIWFIGNKYGLSLSVLQLLVRQRKGGRPTGYAFGAAPTSTTTSTTDTQEETQQDSDTEEVVEEVEEEEEVEEVEEVEEEEEEVEE